MSKTKHEFKYLSFPFKKGKKRAHLKTYQRILNNKNNILLKIL